MFVEWVTVIRFMRHGPLTNACTLHTRLGDMAHNIFILSLAIFSSESFDYWHRSSRQFRRIMIVNIRNCILAFSVFKSVSLVSVYVYIKIDIYRLFL